MSVRLPLCWSAKSLYTDRWTAGQSLLMHKKDVRGLSASVFVCQSEDNMSVNLWAPRWQRQQKHHGGKNQGDPLHACILVTKNKLPNSAHWSSVLRKRFIHLLGQMLQLLQLLGGTRCSIDFHHIRHILKSKHQGKMDPKMDQNGRYYIVCTNVYTAVLNFHVHSGNRNGTYTAPELLQPSL